MFFVSRAGENDRSERQERDESHVVCNEHGADERDIDEKKRSDSQIFCGGDYPFGAHIEKAYFLERAYHCKSGKKTSKSPRVEISEIFAVRRNYKRGNERKKRRDT